MHKGNEPPAPLIRTADVLRLLERAGFSGRLVRKDAQGLDRIAVACRPS